MGYNPAYISHLVTAYTEDKEINSIVRVPYDTADTKGLAICMFLDHHKIKSGPETDIDANQLTEPELSMMLKAGVHMITKPQTQTRYAENISFWLQLE